MNRWKVMPTGNKAGDLAIVRADADKAINRIATVPVRSGFEKGAVERARMIAMAPRMYALLMQVHHNMLLCDDRAGSFHAHEEMMDVLDAINEGALGDES